MPVEAKKGGRWRYSDDVRAMALVAFANSVDRSVLLSLYKTRDWTPASQAHLIAVGNRGAFDFVHEVVTQDAWAESGLGGPDPDKCESEKRRRRNFGRQLKTWILHMVRDSTVSSHTGGEKVRVCREDYATLRDLLLEGWVGPRGETLGYWSIEHAVLKNEAVRAIVLQIGVQPRSVWDNLRRLYPKFQMMQERMKKMRTHADAQKGARQILGLEPMTYPKWVPVRSGLRNPLPVYWDLERCQKQWCVDAFTVDPGGMLTQQLVIGYRGARREAVETPVASAGIAALPKSLIYIALHPTHGLRVFWSETGCRMGKQDAFAQFRTWCAELTEAQKQYIAAFRHMNYNSVVATHATFTGPKDAAGKFTGEPLFPDFHEDNFLVRTLTMLTSQCC